MGLQKQLIEIPASDGLAQKFDVRRLPVGKSVTAFNLNKNKQGRLETRLGFTSLTTKLIDGSINYNPGVGLGVTSWNNSLCSLTRGTWSPTGQFVTAFCSYNEFVPGWVVNGLLPDCNVALDQIVTNTQTNVASPTSVNDPTGQYQIFVWTQSPVGQAAPIAGTVYWCIIDNLTQKMVRPPQVLNSAVTDGRFLQLILVGNIAIAAYSQVSTRKIFAQTFNASFPSTSTWSAATLLQLANVNSTQIAFTISNVTGDNTNFLLATVIANGGVGDLKIFKYSNVLTFISSFVVIASISYNAAAFGMRADVTNDIICLVWWNGSATPLVNAAFGKYSTMSLSTAIIASIYTPLSVGGSFEGAPGAFAVGMIRARDGTLCFNAAWTPLFGRFIAMTAGGGGNTPTLTPQNNARITTIQFKLVSGITTLYQGSGVPPTRVTHGFCLASKFLELNGTLYCLGWIPSPTQGGYVLFAADWAADPDDVASAGAAGTFAWPMRPVANIQTRTALFDPTGALNFGAAPNQHFSLANITLGVGFNDTTYNTAYIAYLASTQGEKGLLASGQFQMTPFSGYPTATWGTMTAVGGALPTCFDGQNLVEQGFLYCADGNNNGNPGGVLGTQLGTYGFIVGNTGSGTTFTWTNPTDSWTWCVTYEWFDAQGNFHQSARQVCTLSGKMLQNWGDSLPFTNDATLVIPTLGATMKNLLPNSNTVLGNLVPNPASPVTIGIYRTGISTGVFAKTFFRVNDRYFNGEDQGYSGALPPQYNGDNNGRLLADPTVVGSGYVKYVDQVTDAQLTDGTHPLLYGDGSLGAPGNLDNFCPPATPIMVRHKERLFVSRGNQILYTKQRGELLGPGYNEQVNVSFVGNDDPLTGAESLDDKFIACKQKQLYYIGGDGPADDGSGSSFSPPQPIPTDSGCVSPSSVKATPEGMYFQSEAGLRLLTRSLAVEYIGGPVEDELATFSNVLSCVLYPTNNKIIFTLGTGPYPLGNASEWITRDYVLDAWTTAAISALREGGGFFLDNLIAGIANAPRTVLGVQLFEPVLHFITQNGGVVYRENDPMAALPYWDITNGVQTFITTIWQTPLIKIEPNLQARFRLWDIIPILVSQDPHGLIISTAVDYGGFNRNDTWTWNSNSAGAHNIAPGGNLTTPGITQLRSYNGRLGEAFQIILQCVQDPASVTGQGCQFLGLTCSIGVAKGPYKLPAGNTQ